MAVGSRPCRARTGAARRSRSAAARPVPEMADGGDERERGRGGQPQRPRHEHGSPARILVVDDEPQIRKFLRIA